MRYFFRMICPPFLHAFLYKCMMVFTGRGTTPLLINAKWYDRCCVYSKEHEKHYTESGYYFLWCVVVDRLLRYQLTNIIDIGCGTGQFAELLMDKGVVEYLGVDFSAKSIELARKKVPQYRFCEEDMSSSDVLSAKNYDCVITLEFLEHVEFDLDVVKKIKPCTRVIATVPSFNCASHVRFFNDQGEVHTRYSKYFSEFDVSEWVFSKGTARFFLFEGIRNNLT